MSRFRPNSPPVVHETVGDETIIVNLDAGVYYALNSSASRLWTELERGVPVAELVEDAARQSGASANEVEGAVQAFIDSLVAEELVVARENGDQQAAASASWPAGAGFETPALERFTDMQELLLLDPIHDIGVGGWAEER